MRISSVAPITAALGLALALGRFPPARAIPNDPLTWAKQVKNLRTQKEALDHLANMDVDKARPAVPALIELFKDTKRPEHLEALARYLDPRTRPILSRGARLHAKTTSTAPRSRRACWAT